jgi:hypothetical protein
VSSAKDLLEAAKRIDAGQEHDGHCDLESYEFKLRTPIDLKTLRELMKDDIGFCEGNVRVLQDCPTCGGGVRKDPKARDGKCSRCHGDKKVCYQCWWAAAACTCKSLKVRMKRKGEW